MNNWKDIEERFINTGVKVHEYINDLILICKENDSSFDEGKICDKYHTFDELYEFRKVYNAALFNAWYKQGLYDVHKSKKHNDGEKCFGKDNWFIVVAMLPTGQITNHYKIDTDWDLFDIPEESKAKYEFDGHTPKDVLDRIKNHIISNNKEVEKRNKLNKIKEDLNYIGFIYNREVIFDDDNIESTTRDGFSKLLKGYEFTLNKNITSLYMLDTNMICIYNNLKPVYTGRYINKDILKNILTTL